MFGLSRREVRFGFVIGATHFGQHFLSHIIPPLIPVLVVALSYPLWQLGLLVGLYSLGSGFGQAPLGILSDRYDRLYILPVGIALTGAGYVLFAAAPGLGTVVPDIAVLGYTFEGGFVVMSLSMLIVGVGSAVVHPAGYPMITDNVAPENKGKILGVFGSSAKLGDATAPAVIGVLILVLVWDRILLLLGVLGIGFGLVLFLVLRDDQFETVPAGRTHGDDVDAVEVRTVDSRTYTYPMIVIYLFLTTKMFSGEGIRTFLPAFIVAVYAYSFEVAGVDLAPTSVANFYFSALLLFAAVAQLVIGGLSDRVDARLLLLAGTGVAAVGFLSLALLDLPPVPLLIVLVLIGLGVYGVAPARDALISDISPPELEGTTFGYIWTAIGLTGAVMAPAVGYIIETRGMRDGFLVLTIGIFLALAVVSLLYIDRIYAPEPRRGAEPSGSD